MALLSIGMAGCVSQTLDTLASCHISIWPGTPTGRGHQILNKVEIWFATLHDSLQRENFIGLAVYCCGRSCQSNKIKIWCATFIEPSTKRPPICSAIGSQEFHFGWIRSYHPIGEYDLFHKFNLPSGYSQHPCLGLQGSYTSWPWTVLILAIFNWDLRSFLAFKFWFMVN